MPKEFYLAIEPAGIAQVREIKFHQAGKSIQCLLTFSGSSVSGIIFLVFFKMVSYEKGWFQNKFMAG